MRRYNLTLKIFFLILLNVIIDSIANVFFKKGILESGVNFSGFNDILSFISANITSLFIWLGIFMYLVNFIIWITVLHQMHLSIAMPIGSIGYIMIPVLAIIFLHESVSWVRWIGIFLIIFGILFVSRSSIEEARYGI